jgi:phosphonate transport system ATP-binding protein
MSSRLRAALPIPSESASPRLVVGELTKTFKGHVAIADINLSLLEHEFVAVLGPSGAGKTTLFRCIAGLLRPDRGTVRIDADDIAQSTGRDRRRIAFVFSNSIW